MIMDNEIKLKATGLKREVTIGGAGLTQQALFAKHLAVMLGSGLALTEALPVSIESATGRLKSALQDVARAVEAGNSASVSISSIMRWPVAIFRRI